MSQFVFHVLLSRFTAGSDFSKCWAAQLAWGATPDAVFWSLHFEVSIVEIISELSVLVL